MIVTTSLRGLATSVVALAATLTFAAGCSSSTSGSALAGGGGGSSTAALGSGASSTGRSAAAPTPIASASIPIASTSLSNAPLGSGGGSNAAFCAKLRGLGTPNISGGTANIGDIAKQFQSLADAAPAEIKGDLQLIADFLTSAVSGTPDTSKISQYTAALTHLGAYLSKNCT